MTAQETKVLKTPHNLILEGRHKLSLSGISDVDSFDEQTIIVYTDLGELCIRGHNLHIDRLSIETGELSVDGEVSSLTYSDQQKAGSGIFSRLFK